jgi:small-conductance mechanosensitive channel
MKEFSVRRVFFLLLIWVNVICSLQFVQSAMPRGWLRSLPRRSCSMLVGQSATFEEGAEALLKASINNNARAASPGSTSSSPPLSEQKCSTFGGKCRKYLHWDFVGTYFKGFLRQFVTDEDTLNLTTKGISGILWFVILAGVLGTLGFDTKPILSIFGVAGITFGLSLQNLFSDLYAGLFVLFTRPFRRGAVISVSGHTGRVMSMDMRYVHLHDEKNHTDVLLPISIVYRNAVTLIEESNEKEQ